MVDPMNDLASREFNAVVFVGPAQCGKTQSLLLNWLAYTAVVDPMDMIMYSPTKGAARDFSMRRIDRLHRDSPQVGKRLLKKRDADNKFDKLYDSGMMLTLSHPSVTEFAGRPIPRVALTDYDRMDDDIEGDGAPFDLATKRTTTFGSFAMTLAESSPSRPVTDPMWIASSEHEAPPTTGILALYNRGDRKRRYWPCPHCDEYFEAKFEHLVYDKSLPNNVLIAESARLQCPHCGEKIHPDQRNEMDMWGRWVADGQRVDSNGRLHGNPRRSNISSYWLRGVAAAFTNWKNLVLMFLTAEEEYERTQDQESLKKFYNTDLGEPYIPRGLNSDRLPEVLKSRAEELPTMPVDELDPMIVRSVAKGRDLFEPMVPDGVRFLTAQVDVQGGSFVVQVHGISPGEMMGQYDICIVDRFNIVKSKRTDGNFERVRVQPGAHQEDWDLIKELVMDRTYRLGDGSDRRMMVKLTTCDSGGREGVTTEAYNFYRRLREAGENGRFHLVKGTATPGAPRAHISYPDSNKKDKFAAARGDVPVLMLQSNVLKDTLANRLGCVTPGKGMVRIPTWMPDFVFTEMCVEIRTDKGWENPKNYRNEAWDLAYYAIGACVSPLLTLEHIDWNNPPLWAAKWDENALIFTEGNNTRFAKQQKDVYDWAKFAKELA